MKTHNLTFKPTVFWAWNSDMTVEEIKSNLSWFNEQGIGGVFVHARSGLNIEYLGEKWFKAFKLTIDECKKHGIEVWIYDEQGWPSGFAGGLVSAFGEDYVIKYLCKTNDIREVDKTRLVAAYKKEDNHYKIVDVEDANTFIYYKIEPPYVDLLNPAVTTKFIETTHEVYKKHFHNEFGKTIKGVFTDEPQIHVSSLAWGIAVETAFKKLNGYDYLDGLPLLFIETDDEKAKKYRYDYYKTIRKLFVENYTKRISEWCRDNNLIFTGHFAAEEGLVIQTASNTGVMPHYEYMDFPGIDSLGKRLNAPLLMKQVQSVAAQWGRKRILSETFACTGNGVSFKELKTLWGYHLSFGVNFPCMSISMTSLGGIRKRDYPVFISNQQPWEKHFHYFSSWVEKTGKLSMLGEYRADVLVLSPVNSILYERICSLQQKIVSSNYRKVIEMLINMQVSYDIGDELLLQRHGKVEDGRLFINKGSYDTVILPEQTGINMNTLKLLETFHAQGGKIVQIERFPKYLDGVKSNVPAQILSKITHAVLQERQGILEKYWLANQINRSVHIVDEYGKTLPDLVIRVAEDKEYMLFSVFNKSTDTMAGFIKINSRGTIFEIDIMTNGLSSKSLYFNENETVGELMIDKGELKYFKFTKAIIEGIEKYSVKTCEVAMDVVGLTDHNLLVIDYAKVEYEGKKVNHLMPTVHILKKLFDEADILGKTLSAKVIYQFNTEVLTQMKVAFEYQGMNTFKINNKILWQEKDPFVKERFKDNSLFLIDISDYIKLGVNEIIINYQIEPLNLGYDIHDVHDSVRNKFSFSSHIEPIYIYGDFDVLNKGRIDQDEKAVSVHGPFVIAKPKPKKIGDITIQNHYFYTGNIIYKGVFEYQSGLVELSLSFDGTGAVVMINDVEIGLFDAYRFNDISKHVKKGVNSISIKLLGSLRNMMGPFHHISKEPEYTGVHTFTGEYGKGAVEDLSSHGITENIWNDEYHVTRLGLYKVVLKKKEKEGD